MPAEKKARHVKLRRRLHERGERRDEAPGEKNPREPFPRAQPLDEQRAGDLEQQIADEKHADAKAENFLGKFQVARHAKFGEADICAVEIRDDEGVAIREPLRIARHRDARELPHDFTRRVHFAHRALALMRGEDVAIRELVKVADLLVKMFVARVQRRDVDDFAFRIHFDGLRRSLLRDERVPIRQPAASPKPAEIC